MQYVTLGKTGLQVSRLGLGGIPIQKADVKSARAILEKMVHEGMNYIDSARGYTVSEDYLGQALVGIRDKFVLATKSMARTKQAMAQDIETSLHNFRTDYLDLYQCHNPSLKDLEIFCAEGGGLEALLEAKAQGKVRHLGLTAHSAGVFEKALELDWVETVMFPYNIVESQGEELIARCREKNIGFIAMKPLAGGAIENPNLALRYILANPNVTVVIPGMYTVKELEQNLAAAQDESALSQEDLAQLEAIRKDLGSNFCRRCNYCAPCTAGIDIPGVFVLKGYFERYGLGQWALDRYAGMKHKASECLDCGDCEGRCPYHLPIRQMLKKTAEEFGS